MGFTLNIKGLDEAVKKSQGLASQAEKGINDALYAFGFSVEASAKQLAPVDEGRTRNAISTKKKPFGVEIVCAVDYASFHEFGTRQLAAQYVSSLPTEWQQYAATFRGSTGGKFDELLRAIMAWVKRKGIDDDAAYPIAKKIVIQGIRPSPFLYPSVIKYVDQLKTDLQNVIN